VSRNDEDDEIDKELRFHLAERADELRAAGLTADEANRQARLELGGLQQVREAVRDQSRWLVVDGWVRDIRVAVRALRRAPVFAATAAAVLGLGIGVNATVFSIVNTVLLQPLPFDRPEDIVRVRRRTPFGSSGSFSMHDYVALRGQHGVESASTILDVLNATRSTLIAGGTAEPVSVLHVSAAFFEVLGVSALNGRVFERGDDVPGAASTAVISEGYWQARFGRDPAVIGRNVTIDGLPHTVIGVAPDSVAAFIAADMYAALAVPAVSNDRANAFQVLARLAPGVALPEAQARMDAVARGHAARDPALTNMPLGVVLRPLHEDIVGAVRPAMRLLAAAVLLVLLVACSNVANVMLVRGFARRREMALMAALGSSRWRVVRSVLTEALVVAALGGMLGLVLAYGALEALPLLPVADLPLADRIHIDGWALAFVSGATILAGVLASLPLVLQLSGPNLMRWLRQGHTQVDVGIGGRRLRSGLACLQVALSTLLLVGAGLLARSVWNLTTLDPGFRADHLLTMSVSVTPSRYTNAERLGAYTAAVSERLARIPSVVAASSTTALPSDFPIDFPVRGAGDGTGSVAEAELLDAWYRAIDPAFFPAMGIPLQRGRGFTAADSGGGAPVVIISRSLADRAVPGGDALGRSIVIGEGFLTDARDLRPRTVVGIAGDTRENGLRSGVTMTMYVPVAQAPEAITSLVINKIPLKWVVRTSGPPGDIVPAARAAVLAVDATQPASSFATMHAVLARSIAPSRLNMVMLLAFGGMALVLAALGIYGLVAYTVAQRTREIGVRVSLGARPSHIVWGLVRQGLVLCLAGTLAGIAGSLVLGRLLRALLFGIESVDVLTVGVVVSLMALVVAAATYLPASRAASIDPVVALRHE
jgi:predicted permease